MERGEGHKRKPESRSVANHVRLTLMGERGVLKYKFPFFSPCLLYGEKKRRLAFTRRR